MTAADRYDTFIAGETIDLVVPDERAVASGEWSGWFNDPETTQYLDQGLFPQSREAQREYLSSLNQPGGDRLVMLIWSKAAAALVGVASVSSISWQHRRCEIALVIGRHAGKSDALFYGLEAKARLTQHAFDVLGMERVGGGQAVALADWQRIQLLFGFRPEGIARKMFRKGQVVHDLALTSCLLEDYQRVLRARADYWPGKAALMEMMRRLPKESVVERVRAAIDGELASYLEKVELAVPDSNR
jgi:RimJ/RimL family protein N-acetyltransferase